ncbi:endo-1,4-beta-xylanase [Actinomadura sp. HBU206391]|uniref:endo-1,4-beta-xylanase n=1 Tax=Actinomadura sp. HBU206391 TaxID=2731692 RepID=UPI001650CD8D|nr:endo-1,4-beta-xylanase [Actinomadura sp. HBU206391]MBC6460450.1 endo-1,4-beta-xylanase [Actinomadura sp. HBU206391]
MTSAPHPPRRRRAFTALTATVLTALTATGLAAVVATAPSSTAATTLGSAASSKGKTFGTAVSGNRLSESQYATTLDTEFTGVTAENEMKWDATEPSRNSFNYAAGDAIVNRAQTRGQKVRGHTLVWHSQLPGWVSGVSSGTDLLQAMRNHVSNVAGHYQGKIVYWDVVNEAFEENGSRRQSVFQQRIGNSYIEEAFRAARAADPGAKLCYNDYNTDAVNAKSDAVYNMVRDFQARGVPIDCVGFQTHLIVGQVPSNFQANLQRFASLGLDVNITELDIRMPTPASSGNLQTQASDYRKVVQACVAVSRCTSITVWGITDRYSWVPDTFPGQGAALLFDDNYAKKPAYNAVIEGFGSPTDPPTTPTPTPPVGGCRVTYAMNTWNNGFTTNITITNGGSSAINGWSLVFTLPSGQTITSGWNASYSPSSGQVTARNVGFNGTINANGSVGVGFQATHTGNTGRPSSFTLNGTACTVA